MNLANDCYINFVINSSFFQVSLATFAVFVLSSPDNTLDAQTVFVSMSLFHMLQGPIGRMPHLVAALSQVSLLRFKFLTLYSATWCFNSLCPLLL